MKLQKIWAIENVLNKYCTKQDVACPALTTLAYSKPKKVEAILSYFKKNIILAQKLAKYRLKKKKKD